MCMMDSILETGYGNNQETLLLICLQMDSDDSIPVMDLANQEYQVSPLTQHASSL